MFKRLFAGHWSPIAGYLPEQDLIFVLGKAQNDAVVSLPIFTCSVISWRCTVASATLFSSPMAADVNEKYGAYLVPSRRFYDAVHTQSLLDGMWRGLVRVDVKV